MIVKAVCIDFETANSFMGSICSVGLAIIEDGCLVDKKCWLVRPHVKHSRFHPMNVRIHGIKEQDVQNEDEFDFVYSQIKPLLSNAVIIAHNAAFDIAVLRNALDLYGMEYPEVDYLCTCKIAQKTWIGLENYKLNTVCKFLKHDFIHHNAQEDAVACGKVMLSAMSKNGVSSIPELVTGLGIRMGKLYHHGYIPCSSKKNKTIRITKI